MGILRIAVISESTSLFSGLETCFNTSPLVVELEQFGTFHAFSDYCAEQVVHAVIADASISDVPLSGILQRARYLNNHCAVYVVFDTLDEERASDVIKWGATAFALKNNLSSIVASLLKINACQGMDQDIKTFDAIYAVNANQILNALLQESTDSIWVKDKNGKYLLINPAGAAMLRKPIDQVIGKTDYEVFPIDAANKIVKSDQGVILSGATQTIEDLISTPDGVRRTFLAVKGVFRDAQGQIQGVFGTVRDITARKQAEIALQESEQRFRLLVEGAKDYAIYMLDPEGFVTTWNIGAERLQGYSSTDIIGKHFSCFYSEDSASMLSPEMALQTAIEHRFYEQEGWQIRKDGSKYWGNVIMTPLYNERNDLIGFSSIVRDMSERRKVEEALRYYTSRLEQSNKDLEQFAFIASHDLQAPLRKIRLFSEMIQDYVGPDGQDTIKRLQAAVIKMQHFISDLLALSRINRQGRPFRRVPLNDVLAGALEDLEPIIREHNAILTLDSLDFVYGDDVQLEQLFLNILGNSLKFRRKNICPEIKISGELLDSGFYRITIQDNGIGFKEQYLDKIFRPFERLHGESQFPGTGMGLAICQKITERHGGQITASSKEGEGSTFIICLPTQPENEVEAEPSLQTIS
jgi:PAS domain S-box-containing protein